MQRLLGAFDRTDVPVSVGKNCRYDRAYYMNQLSSFCLYPFAVPVEKTAPNTGKEALEWLSELLEVHQGITYISVGPLTNLAALLKAFPEKARTIGKVVMIAGWYRHALPEWNVAQDAEAALTVIKSGIPVVSIGYDVTLKCILSQEHLAALKASPRPGAKLLMSMLATWSKRRSKSILYLNDPLAVAYVCDPAIIKTEECRVLIETQPGPEYGVMYKSEDGYPITYTDVTLPLPGPPCSAPAASTHLVVMEPVEYTSTHAPTDHVPATVSFTPTPLPHAGL